MKPTRRTAVAVTLASAALLATPAAAHADTVTGADLGQHIPQTMGFTGSHNPRMHHGFAGWNAVPYDM